MWRCAAILLSGLALSTGPASAQEVKSYSLTVSAPRAVLSKLTQDKVKVILQDASEILQGKGKYANDGNSCKVEFTLKELIPFPSSAPAKITKESDLEKVHAVPADVKIVQSIGYCAQGKGRYWGCAWRPGGGRRTVIISFVGISIGVGPEVLAHEFGHTTGLPHRYQADRVSGGRANLMTPCGVGAFSRPINEDECAHFLKGPAPPPYQLGEGPGCLTGGSGHTD